MITNDARVPLAVPIVRVISDRTRAIGGRRIEILPIVQVATIICAILVRILNRIGDPVRIPVVILTPIALVVGIPVSEILTCARTYSAPSAACRTQ